MSSDRLPRIISAILITVLFVTAAAAAAGCGDGCDCMTPSDAKLYGYEPCNGKLSSTPCDRDRYGTAMYCYATFRASQQPAAVRQGLPDGYYAFRVTGRGRTEDGGSISVDSTIRYDISTESYGGRTAMRMKITMQTTSPEGSARMNADMYTDPSTGAILGGTATATANGKTQTVNLADVGAVTSQSTGTEYAQSGGAFGTAGLESSLQEMARQTGSRVVKTTETVSVPAGTFPSATKYSVTVRDDEGNAATMNFWTAPNVPVIVKMEGHDSAGAMSTSMVLTGYSVTGSPLGAAGPLSGITGSGENPFAQLGSAEIGELQEAVTDALQDTLDSAGLGEVDVERIPSAASESVVPAAIGAAGALAGLGLGLSSIVPAGGFPETTGITEGGEGPGGSGGADAGGQLPEEETGTGPGGDSPGAPGGAETTDYETLAGGAGAGGTAGAPETAPPVTDGSPDTDSEGAPAPEAGPDDTGAPAAEAETTGTGEPAEEPGPEPEAAGASAEAPEESVPDASPAGEPAETPGSSGPSAEEGGGAGGGEQAETDEPPVLQEAADADTLDDEMRNLELLQDLRSRVDAEIARRTREGFYIKNPNLPRKVWNWTIGGLYHWFRGDKGGQCGDAAQWGKDWLTDGIKNIYGNETIVEEIVVNADGWSNHASTQFVTKNGDRYIVDMWDGMSKGSARVMPEDEWLNKWKDRIGGNPPVLRNNYELQLEDAIRKNGSVKEGIDDFLHMYRNSENANITVKSYTKNPWFIP